MKLRPAFGLAIGLAAACGLLSACHRPTETAQAPAAAPVGPERAGPATWNAKTGGFELNGKPVTAVKLWTFEGSTDGFTTMGSKITPAAPQGATVVVGDPILRSPKGLNVPGSRYSLVLVRLTRIAPGALWDGALYYATAAHREAASYFAKPLAGADPKVGETVTLVYDMAHQKRGAPDWMQSTIDSIRLDLEDRPGGVFLIRQIAIGENPDPDATAAMAPAPKPGPAAADAAPAPAPAKP
ncbi:MAG: hypothetical protein JSS35_19995 [Proteobacteria bacterium]|nr:hypothetical protein [Pseudomonadota bacterium]